VPADGNQHSKEAIPMRVLDATATADLLGYQRVADAVAEVIGLERQGRTQAPPRGVMALPEDGTLLLMPATDGEVAITKLVTVHPRNGARQLPTIQGEMSVMDAATGRRLALVDGATVSARRTAAVSLLAAQRLAPRTDTPLFVYGAGTQARVHIEAFREGFGTDTVYLYSRTRERAESLAEHARRLGMRAQVVSDPQQALAECRLVVAATTATRPILPERLPEDTFVAAVGAFRPHMAELPPQLVASGAVVIDTEDGARDEAGDLIQAAEQGAFRWSDALELAAVICDGHRPAGGPVLFKSVGQSLWDLAAGRVIAKAL
jgi:ornithine cyclodeaminase